MKIVVFTCSTGGGHNACANYIKEEFNRCGVFCDVQNYFDLVGKNASNVAEKVYLGSTKGNGFAFGSVYKLGELYNKTKIPSPVYGANLFAKGRLIQFLKENQYDLAICTHLFPSHTLTAIQKDYPIPFINIATDYECIPFWRETKPNYFVIPSSLLMERFEHEGFSSSTLLPFGISISSRFLDQEISNDIQMDGDMILITSGSMGFGRLKDVVIQMLKEIPNTYIVVVCGNNQKVFEELSQIDDEKLIVKGFVHNMNEYMKASTLVLTKPGGVTTTEAASLRKPFILMQPIPGVEDYNAEFFTSNRMCLKAKNTEDLIKETKRLLEDKDLQKELVANQEKYIPDHSAKKLVDFVMDKMNKSQDE